MSENLRPKILRPKYYPPKILALNVLPLLLLALTCHKGRMQEVTSLVSTAWPKTDDLTILAYCLMYNSINGWVFIQNVSSKS